MNLLTGLRARASAANQAAQQGQPGGGPPDNSVIDYLNSVASGFDYIINHPLSSIDNGVEMFAGLITGNQQAAYNAAVRLIGQGQNDGLGALRTWTRTQLGQLETQLVQLRSNTIHWIFQSGHQLELDIKAAIAAEVTARNKAVSKAEQQARTEDTALHQSIEREAASAYRATISDHLGTLTRIADLIATRDPLVKAVVSRIVRYIIDLAVIDNPVARLTASFLIRHLINRLGIEKVIGDLLGNLASGILDAGEPRNLHDVILAIGHRLNALDKQWAEFMDHGGPEVEQAGDLWKHADSAVTEAALLAFYAQAVAEPKLWATEVSDTIGVVINDTLAPIARLIGGK